jgi:hypothetical protein
MCVDTQMFGEEEVLMDQIQGIDLRKVHMPLLVGMGLDLGHWQIFVDHFKRMLDEVRGGGGRSKGGGRGE